MTRRRREPDLLAAQRDAALFHLRSVLRLLDRKEYRPAPQQGTIAAAEAFLVEAER